MEDTLEARTERGQPGSSSQPRAKKLDRKPCASREEAGDLWLPAELVHIIGNLARPGPSAAIVEAREEEGSNSGTHTQNPRPELDSFRPN